MNPESIPFKSGFVALVGRPNVGKSTLVNALLKQKIAAVSSRPQTTRKRQFGILTLPNAQLVLVDLPGIHRPAHKLDQYMNDVALAGLEDADVIVWIVDASQAPTEEDRLIAGRLNSARKLPPVVMAFNKIDLLSEEARPGREQAFGQLCPADALLLPVSAVRGSGEAELLQAVIDRLPEGEPYYSEEDITDYYERDIAIELIRAAAMQNLRDELPHAIAVRLDEYRDRDEQTAYIAATILVERETQKGMVIGKAGAMLKRIGSAARADIEAMTGRKVFLDLHVKVSENWRDNPQMLRLLGYEQDKGD